MKIVIILAGLLTKSNLFYFILFYLFLFIMRVVIGLVIRDTFPGVKKRCLEIAAQVSDETLDDHLRPQDSKMWIKLANRVRHQAEQTGESIEDVAAFIVSSDKLEELTEDVVKEFLRFFGAYYLENPGGFDFEFDDFCDSFNETFVTFLK